MLKGHNFKQIYNLYPEPIILASTWGPVYDG